MLREILCSGFSAAFLLLAQTAGGADGDAPAELRTLFDDEWEFRLRENPEFATSVGDRRFNDRLRSVSPTDFERRLDAHRRFLARLRAIDRDALSPAEQISYDIFERLKVDRIRELEFRSHLMPVTNRHGFHIDFMDLPDEVPLSTVQDYENYIARLEAFRQYTEQHIALMRQGIREGFVVPRIGLDGYEETITPHIVEDPTESLLFKPFKAFPGTIAGADRDRLTEAGRRAIMSAIVPSYRAFQAFMADEYAPAAREEIAASALPNGRAFYAHRVRRYTTLEITPEEVHAKGQAEVARIRKEMEAVLGSVGFEGSFAEFLEFLRTDDRFYVETPEDLLAHTALILKRMDGELPRLFGRLPRMPYGIKPIPDYIAPRTTTAYYQRPAGDGTRAGVYFVNTYDLPSRPLYEIEALSLHEAVPGHHLQIALQQELEGLPMFRRFAGFTAFVEGWALYAERLGLETGFYEDPYSNFGRLTYEMWRACRLVVDPGIHALGWTRQQAINFMAENSALSIHNITTEVDRYITWPGQSIAYKTGELKIRELRERAERALGAGFDIRRFHDVVLENGSVPLDVLEKMVDAYIAGARGEG